MVRNSSSPVVLYFSFLRVFINLTVNRNKIFSTGKSSAKKKLTNKKLIKHNHEMDNKESAWVHISTYLQTGI